MDKLETHEHTGSDGTKQLDPRNFLGFPIFTAIPTQKALEGSICFVKNSGNYYLYAMLDKVWRGVQLTL